MGGPTVGVTIIKTDRQTGGRTDRWTDRQVCAWVCQVCAWLCQVCPGMSSVS